MDSLRSFCAFSAAVSRAAMSCSFSIASASASSAAFEAASASGSFSSAASRSAITRARSSSRPSNSCWSSLTLSSTWLLSSLGSATAEAAGRTSASAIAVMTSPSLRAISDLRVLVQGDQRRCSGHDRADDDEHGRDEEDVPAGDDAEAGRLSLQAPGGREVDEQSQGSGREGRTHDSREHSLEQERQLNEGVRGADQPHDAGLPASRERRESDGRGDEQHGAQQHDAGDGHGHDGRDVEHAEETVEQLVLVDDLLDARGGGERLLDDVVLLGV